MTTEAYETRINLDLKADLVTYNPNIGQKVSDDGADRLVEDESAYYSSSIKQNIFLAKDAADQEVLPAVITGVRFVFIRVKRENMATAPANGTFLAKITDAGSGVDQIVLGDTLILRNKTGTITSIKLTNNEADDTGVELPISVILGGINS